MLGPLANRAALTGPVGYGDTLAIGHFFRDGAKYRGPTLLWQPTRDETGICEASGPGLRASRKPVPAPHEEGKLYALDGKCGASICVVGTGANDYGARGFIAAAATTDLDGDGSDDVVAGARDGILTAYRGSDGLVLWHARASHLAPASWGPRVPKLRSVSHSLGRGSGS